MYIPELYKNDDQEEIREFLKANAFGILVSQQNGRSLATHIPLELITEDGTDLLHAHISKENPQWHNFEDGMEVLCIFQGPHSYISSSWYDFPEVPTWNYTAVHVYGTLRMIKGKRLYERVRMLVDKYEAASACPVVMDELPKEVLRQMQGIVGFEIDITEIHAAKKMSQNRDDHNLKNIVEQLHQSGDPMRQQVAETMKETRKQNKKKEF
ncbi:FMN-binding negative transcriptional regulator [Croceiramulus getboli]|nr:FMN-binding negative transcriptional regulator [Flavobacteriaceae bacterium YJPT1-3]